jgi:competence protein ComEC
MKPILIAAVLLLAGCVAPTLPGDQPTAQNPVPNLGPGNATVTFVDVGQGDGTIWQLGDKVIVYDCGDARSSAETNPMVLALRSLGYPSGSTLHALVASHGHSDHVAGCSEVLQEYAFQHVYDTWYDGDDRPQAYRRFQDELTGEGAVLHTLGDGPNGFRAGHILAAGDGYEAKVLWPAGPQVTSWDDIAENSIVVRLQVGSTSFCFQGDIETAQEALIVDANPDLRCTAYLAGHHGSSHASSGKLLTTIRPEFTIVSSGNNTYGHPTSQALCRLQSVGTAIFVTWRLGTITVSSDGSSIGVSPGGSETADYCALGTRFTP